MDYGMPGSSVHGILQARILEWVAIPFSRGSSWPWDWTRVFCIAGRFFMVWATREAHRMCLCVSVLVVQLCLTLCNSTDCSPSGSSVHGICQARILEWVAIPFSRGSFWLRDRTQVSCIAARFFTVWATSEALVKDYYWLFPALTMKPGSI